MRYFVSAADEDRARRVRERLRAAGYDVVPEYDDEAVVLSLGGDGAILYNARTYGEPTLLPVRVEGSEGNRIQVGVDAIERRVATLEAGVAGEDYHVERHRKLAATVDGEPLRDGFRALNDVHLHHASPVHAAKYAVTVADGGRELYSAETAIGDGLLVATPFGSTGYYRSITRSTFERGVGVAFNNHHKPVDAPESVVGSTDLRVRLRTHETHGQSAVLARDDDPDTYPLDPGDAVEIYLSDRGVGIVRFTD